MMSSRLVELRRVLKPTGSLYLHCDPTLSHYLKLLCDRCLADNYRNEISWKRPNQKSYHNQLFKLPRHHPPLRKNTGAVFNKVFGKHDPDYIEKFYRFTDPPGVAIARRHHNPTRIAQT